MAQQAYASETAGGAEEPDRRRARLRRLIDGWRHDRGIWRRGLVLAAFAVLVALVMICHAQIPNTIGNLGSLNETFLPWLGVLVPVLLALALVRKSATAFIAVLVPAIVWSNLFGSLITDKTGRGGDLTVATHNVNADNPDPSRTA